MLKWIRAFTWWQDAAQIWSESWHWIIGSAGGMAVIASCLAYAADVGSLGIFLSLSSAAATGVVLSYYTCKWSKDWKSWRRSFEPGHGLTTKRAKEKQWCEEIDQLMARGERLRNTWHEPDGNDDAQKWVRDVLQVLDDWLVDSTNKREMIEAFKNHTSGITRDRDVANSIESGIKYLNRIRNIDGGRLK